MNSRILALLLLPLSSLVCLYLVATESFWFCNWPYHLLVREDDFFNQTATKMRVLLGRIVNPLWLCMLIPLVM